MHIFFHNSCVFPNPCNSSFVKVILEGCKRVSANFVSSKKGLPICLEHLHALVQRFAGVNASLSDIRDVCLCLVSFAGFLCFKAACNISNLQFVIGRILGGVTLISRLRIFLCIFLEVKPTIMVPGQQR